MIITVNVTVEGQAGEEVVQKQAEVRTEDIASMLTIPWGDFCKGLVSTAFDEWIDKQREPAKE